LRCARAWSSIAAIAPRSLVNSTCRNEKGAAFAPRPTWHPFYAVQFYESLSRIYPCRYTPASYLVRALKPLFGLSVDTKQDANELRR
jgi:hypothetical protein